MPTLILAAALLLLAASITPFIPVSTVFNDLFAHFPLQYMIAAIVLCVAALWFKAPVAVYPLSIAAFVVCLYHIKPYIEKTAHLETPAQTVRVLHANILIGNTDTTRFEKLVAEKDPDMIFVQELNTPFARLLAGMKDRYPHQILLPNDDFSRGIGVAARTPFSNNQTLHLDHKDVPAISMSIHIGDKRVDLLYLHPLTPLSSIRSRDRELARAADWAKDRKGAAVVFGDLNTTPYSTVFKKLLRDTGLVDIRNGRGLYGSFPLPLPSALRIPIDHFLYTDHLRIRHFSIEKSIGSDHAPFVVEFGF